MEASKQNKNTWCDAVILFTVFYNHMGLSVENQGMCLTYNLCCQLLNMGVDL